MAGMCFEEHSTHQYSRSTSQNVRSDDAYLQSSGLALRPLLQACLEPLLPSRHGTCSTSSIKRDNDTALQIANRIIGLSPVQMFATSGSDMARDPQAQHIRPRSTTRGRPLCVTNGAYHLLPRACKHSKAKLKSKACPIASPPNSRTSKPSKTSRLKRTNDSH